MANMFCYANKVATEFMSVSREVRVVNLVVDRLPPVETEKMADVWC